MSTQHTTADLKSEIEKMEEEKEQLIKRLERAKKRVRSFEIIFDKSQKPNRIKCFTGR